MKHLIIVAAFLLVSCFHDSDDGDDLFEETASGSNGNSGSDLNDDGDASETADDGDVETGGGTGGVGSEGSEETSGGGSTGGGDTDTSEPGDGGSTGITTGPIDSTADTTSGNDTSSGETSTLPDSTACTQGSEGCQCFPNDTCLNNELACETGICVACAVGMTRCNGVCKNTQTDDANCGGCGNACTIAYGLGHCSAGECGPIWSECKSGGNCESWCGAGRCSTGCGNAVTSFSSWGECDTFSNNYNLNVACSTNLGTNIIRCCCEQ